jgi:hypothetical protein
MGPVYARSLSSIVQNKPNFPRFRPENEGRPKKQSQFPCRSTALVSPLCEGPVRAAVGWLRPCPLWYNGWVGPQWVALDRREEIS